MCRSKYALVTMLICLISIGFMAIAKDKDKDPAPAGGGAVTVGDFAMEVVKMADDNPANLSSLTPEKAIDRLGKAGLFFHGASGSPLSDKDKSNFFLAMANGLLVRIAPPPEGFESCAELTTVKECHACCLSLQGASNKSCGRSCGQVHANQQKASPSEPTP